MCGGNLTIENDERVCTCTFCGTQQTVPSLDNDKKIKLFERANRLRSMSEFDKAYGVYESIVEEFNEEAEAYWGLVLCKYGIEYVDDVNGSKVPTCHRSSFESVLEDSNFEMALEYADVIAQSVYRNEAKAIERLRRDIIEVSQKQAPYDIFICYKETDENGGRTIDSVIAQDVYDELTSKGYTVFFSRISLEDKLGVEYEPYIFSALHSAKIMLAFGTKYEYYNAVWVKNEWSRFLKLISQGEKKTLIPCFKELDIEDMPTEFRRLQAQDMGKVGATQDLLRGIEKILGIKKVESAPTQTFAQSASPTVDNYLKRVSDFLEEKDWQSVNTYCEKILDADFSNANAYLGKYLAEHRVSSLDELANIGVINTNSVSYRSIQKYGDDSLKESVKNAINLNKYNKAMALYNQGSYIESAEAFKKISEYRDSMDFYNSSIEKQNEIEYNEGLDNYKKHNYEKAMEIFENILDYKDSRNLYNKSIEENREAIYNLGVSLLKNGNYKDAFDKLSILGDYKDSRELSNQANKLYSEKLEKDRIYTEAIKHEKSNTYNGYIVAYEAFKSISGYLDSDVRSKNCISNARNCLIAKKRSIENEKNNLSTKGSSGKGLLVAAIVLLFFGGFLFSLILFYLHFKNRRPNTTNPAQVKQRKKEIDIEIKEIDRKLLDLDNLAKSTGVNYSSLQNALAYGKNINAPMQGQILRVYVSVGQTVKKGDVLMVLEAMKMQNDIVAPKSGIIADVNVSQNQYVHSGQVLCVIN